MFDPLTLGLTLGAAALSAGVGAAGSAANVGKARREESRAYQDAQSFLTSQYYRDPLSTVGNRALLKTLDQRMRDNMDALNNRAVAGGATMENQLAARQANNETMSGVYSQLLQGEEARRNALDQQRLGLSQQHSASLQNGYLQSAQDWQNWGAQMASGSMQLGGSTLIDPKYTGLKKTTGTA